MSFSPSLSLVRLQELKLWQGSYENLIQKSKSNNQPLEYEDLQGVSVVDNSNASDFPLEGINRNSKDWDKKTIKPSKPFEQLLEEKLAEDTPMEGKTKPKRPFLRKGQGLARFKMGATPPVNNKNKNVNAKKPAGNQKSTHIPHEKPPPTPRKGILKKTNPLYHQYVDLSPLTLPDFVKPRGTWKSVFEGCGKSFKKESSQESGNNVDEYHEEVVENYEEFRKSLGYGENIAKSVREVEDNKKSEKDEHMFTHSSSKEMVKIQNGDGEIENEEKSMSEANFEEFNDKILEKINQYARKYFHPARAYVSNDIPETFPETCTLNFNSGSGDLTLYEQKLERELEIFETLEKKVENSSFCSTDTSVANLLAASTPQKATKNDEKIEFLDAKGSAASLEILDNVEVTSENYENIQLKLREVVEKTDVLQQFLMNLRKMEHKDMQEENLTVVSDITKKSASTNTSFSEEQTRWSTRSPSLTDNYTESDTTCQSDSWKKIDVGVNTSFEGSGLDETMKKLGPCEECEELRSKFSQAKTRISEMQLENSDLRNEMRELEKKYEQLKKDLRKNKENYQEKIVDLQEELEKERKKLAKEKTYFETYIKDFQNRPSKKEREEITQLKQELADSKELLKLKDTKNGATQARFRTQIKQQEKEITELKITVEKLQKENAKLSVSEKYKRRPQETKMLHEINKNLSKLTEETFKKQLSKSGNPDAEEKDGREVTREREKSESGDKLSAGEDSEKYGKNAINKEMQKNVSSKENCSVNSAGLDLTNYECLAVEKQYEQIFGKFSSPRNTSVSANLEKTEKLLPDGSTEITYSNGNFKTISADGQLIVIKYFNGDTKETNLNEKIIRYHYAAANTWHIQYPDGTEVMEYGDGQRSKKYPDGKTEVSYPDGSIRIINADGTEQHQFPDGRKSLKTLEGEQIILLPNGQREIHTKQYKRREYPDGTIRTLHKDGSVETVYSNGRVRLKDSNGVLIIDTQQSPLPSKS